MAGKTIWTTFLKFCSSQCQFHQRFFARFFRTNVLFGSFSNYVLALAPKFRTKNVRVNVDEIDGQLHYGCTSCLQYLKFCSFITKFVFEDKLCMMWTFKQKIKKFQMTDHSKSPSHAINWYFLTFFDQNDNMRHLKQQNTKNQ